MERLIVLHRAKPFLDSSISSILSLNSLASPHMLTFETCLRSVYILDQNLMGTKDNELIASLKPISSNIVSNAFCIFYGKKAYEFLLEIVSGLHSEIKGETEIFGQFKKFFADAKKMTHSNHSKQKHLLLVLSNIIKDCKYIREKHIKNWGSQSYGSLTRKILGVNNLNTNSEVYILGAGILAKEIAPWMGEVGDKNLLVRSEIKDLASVFNSFKVQNYFNSARPLKSKSSRATLIIAAPISNSILLEKLDLSSFTLIIDWRGDDKLSVPDTVTHRRYIHLHHINSIVGNSHEEMKNKIQKVKTEIRSRSLLFYNRVENFPWGWDDICA